MIYFPNAKINLGLKITGKREDGFHELSSVFLPVNWCDVLEVHLTETKGLQLNIIGLEIDADTEDNLIFRAYNILNKKYNLPGIKATLKKVIPSGAGLGGGSSDGSFMLKAINEMCGLNLSIEELELFASELGSDCPFFIRNSASLVEGRGEKIRIIEEDMKFLKDYEILIVHPGLHVNTAEAFKLINGEFTQKLDLSNPTDLNGTFSNDFESKVAANHPGIQDAIDFVKSTNAVYVQMTGTGSAVFSLYPKGSVNGYALKHKAQERGYSAYFGAL